MVTRASDVWGDSVHCSGFARIAGRLDALKYLSIGMNTE